MLWGMAVSRGGVVSWTVTVKLTMTYPPELSAADVQATVVWPTGKVDPELGLQVTGRFTALPSVTAGIVKLTADPPVPVASTVIFGGWDAMISDDPSKKLRGAVVVPWSLVAIG